MAADLLKTAAAAGDDDAQVALAMLHLKGEELPRDVTRAKELLEQVAKNGHAGAALELGHLFCGKFAADTRIEMDEAVKWYGQAAKAGDPEAQYAIGMVYVNGDGVAKDAAEGAKWIERAAHSNHAPSQFQLGVMSCAGSGIPQDFAQAVTWYELAARLGHAPAQYNLAVMLRKGQGCAANLSEAQSWLEKAAAQGLEIAQTAHKQLNECKSHDRAVFNS
jgi:TPR repeat protein